MFHERADAFRFWGKRAQLIAHVIEISIQMEFKMIAV
jgi:hypothetical protein